MTSFVRRFLIRTPLRTAVRASVLLVSVALLGAMVLFIGNSLRTMTATTVRSVSLDWQGPVGSASAAKQVAASVAKQSGVAAAEPVATAPFAGAQHTSSAGTIRAGAGFVVAVPPRYQSEFHTFRMLYGSLRSDGVVLDQQLAATLQAGVGDTVLMSPRAGAKPVPLKVTGVAVVSAGDTLFQPLIPLLGPTPASPPADVAIMPFASFVKHFGSTLGAVAPSSASAAAAATGTAGITYQVQAQVEPTILTGSPQHALGQETHLRNKIERSLPGQVQFVDNLESSLTGAAGDALYAEALYIMLAVPGALVGLGLAYLAALGAVDRDRRMLRLLRARGASRKKLLLLAAIESAFVGLFAGALGAALALLTVKWVVGGNLTTWPWAVGVCVVVGFLGSFAGRVAAGVGALREEQRSQKPLWQRLYLDLVALAVSGLVWWLTARTGFSAVVSPDSNPTLSLSVYMFLAPALLWIGSTLLLVRIRGRLFELLAPKRATKPRDFLLVSAARRAASINRGLVIVALLLAFAVNLSVFSATWDQQSLVDARLTVGSDIVVSGANGVQPVVAQTPGITGTTALDHTYAYVGPDLQDVFAIDPATFQQGTSLRDSYFLGGSAKQMMNRLAARPDAILVSKETITDYSLNLGDLLKLRTLDHRTGTFHVVPFHVAGVVQEFPSAPKDSFMVANLAYILQATHDPGANVVFAQTSGNPSQVARVVAQRVTAKGALVKNISDQATQTASSITTVGLRGISRIEEAFALLLAAGALILYSVMAFAERRQELATMAALGKKPRSIARFIWTEIVLIVVVASALASVLGWVLAEMLIAMMQHAFDPPPDHLAIPWGFLGALALVVVAGAALAAIVAERSVARMPLGAVLREE
ncbi:MAG: putative transport system permease protein [Gaiellaceae bacterium]|nr:putative transport system permease protein [Gaiellaceae bacterium]